MLFYLIYFFIIYVFKQIHKKFVERRQDSLSSVLETLTKDDLIGMLMYMFFFSYLIFLWRRAKKISLNSQFEVIV